VPEHKISRRPEAINDPDEAAPRLEGILRADDVVSLLHPASLAN
jgi:hypothetical protein